MGLLLGAFTYMLATGGAIPMKMHASVPVLVAAGLLLEFGTRLGSGCTSGHVLCGVARLSKRSIVATPVFAFVAAMMAGMVLYAWVFERPDRGSIGQNRRMLKASVSERSGPGLRGPRVTVRLRAFPASKHNER
jgi:uncharacterized membrane protein YedE/YeeE